MSFQHFIISRFNLGLYDRYEKEEALKWMDYRLKVFDCFTYPSIISQSNQNFIWLVLFDNKTSNFHRQIISKYLQIIPIYCKSTSIQDLSIEGVKSHLQSDTDYIITTRVDVDDIISRNFVERIQLESPKEDNVQLVFSLGYVLRLHDNILMEREYIYNQFPSYIERVTDDIRTVWFTQHNLMHKTAKTKIISQGRMWCWLLHKKNLCTASVPNNYKLPEIDIKILQNQFVFKETLL